MAGTEVNNLLVWAIDEQINQLNVDKVNNTLTDQFKLTFVSFSIYLLALAWKI